MIFSKLKRPTPHFPTSLIVLLVASCLAGPNLALGAQSKNSSQAASKPKTSAKSSVISKDPYIRAIVLDAASRRVLFEENADAKGYPASVLKIMDLAIIL